MTTKDNIFDLYAQAYESQKQHSMSLREYLEGCRNTPAMYASTAERVMWAEENDQPLPPHEEPPFKRQVPRAPL